MIERVRGRVLAKGPTRIVLDVAGFGIEMEVTGRVLARLGEGAGGSTAPGETTVLTRMLVREDGVRLVGFADEEEREAFDRLQSVAGVGPRLALAVLSTVGPDVLVRCVATGDLDPILRTPGVGKKLAQRIALDLRDWARERAVASPVWAASLDETRHEGIAADGGEPVQDDATAALLGLGFSVQEARVAVAAARRESPDADTASLVRAGLRFLSNTRFEGRSQ